MDLRTDPGAAEVPHVSPALEFRAASTNDVKVVKSIGKGRNKSAPPLHLAKYYAQRFRLFHRFDAGVVLDEESWYSVTPEKIAAHIAERFTGKGVVLDCFSGAGGNCIQFALGGAYVIGIELSPQRIEVALTNAQVYGVRQYMDFIQGDVYDVLPTLAGCQAIEGVFMSPPWGGPAYKDQDWYDVSEFAQVVQLAKNVSPNLSILLPRNVRGDNITKWFGSCELERNFLADKFKTVTLYFGNLVDNQAKAAHNKARQLDRLVM